MTSSPEWKKYEEVDPEIASIRTQLRQQAAVQLCSRSSLVAAQNELGRAYALMTYEKRVAR